MRYNDIQYNNEYNAQWDTMSNNIQWIQCQMRCNGLQYTMSYNEQWHTMIYNDYNESLSHCSLSHCSTMSTMTTIL